MNVLKVGLSYRALPAFTLVTLFLVVSITTSSSSADDKMTAEQVVAKHLQAIGADETLASIKNRVITGTLTATFTKQAVSRIPGKTVMASEGNKQLLGMVFDSTNYPKDNVGFDGNKVTVSFIRPGERSFLGNFLLTHEVVVKQGLVGGILSSGWPLLDSNLKGAKLQYAGVKKIDGRPAHEVRYLPRGGAALNISLFFDLETFRHIRTEYGQVISAQMGSRPELSAYEKESRYKMVEEFSDFKKEGGLNLPHAYKLKITVTNPKGTLEAQWEFNFITFMFNQRLDPGSFNVASS